MVVARHPRTSAGHDVGEVDQRLGEPVRQRETADVLGTARGTLQRSRGSAAAAPAHGRAARGSGARSLSRNLGHPVQQEPLAHDREEGVLLVDHRCYPRDEAELALPLEPQAVAELFSVLPSATSRSCPMICARASRCIVSTVVRSLNARIPKGPICRSSDAGFALALPLETGEQRLRRQARQRPDVGRLRQRGDDLRLTAAGGSDEQRPDGSPSA